MNTKRFAQLALAAGIAAAVSAPVFAAPAGTVETPATTEQSVRGDKMRGYHHDRQSRHHARGYGHPGEYGHAMFRGLDLTDEQQDKIFQIRHAAAPAIREAIKDAHEARQALRDVTRAEQFDEARAKELTEAGAKAMAEAGLLRAKVEHEVYGVLTPEQRTKLKERADRPRHGRRGGPRQSANQAQPATPAAPTAPAAQ